MNHNVSAEAVEESSSPVSGFISVVVVVVSFVGILMLGLSNGLADNGIYEVLEFIALTSFAILAVVNYHNYVASFEKLNLKRVCGECIRTLNGHFGLCAIVFIISGALVIYHAPAVWVMLCLSTIYYIYLRSNYKVLQSLSDEQVKASIKAPSSHIVSLYVNSISNSAFFLKQENSVSFIGYILLTLFCAVIYTFSIAGELPKAEADALGAFAAGAAVVHLGISAVKFRKIVRSFQNPQSAQAAAAADIIELVLFVVGEDCPDGAARADRAADVATSITDGRILRRKKRNLLGWILLAALIASILVTVVSVAKPIHTPSQQSVANERAPHGNSR